MMTSGPKAPSPPLGARPRSLAIAGAVLLAFALLPAGRIAARIHGAPLEIADLSSLIAIRLAFFFSSLAAFLLALAPTRRTLAFVALSAAFALAGFLRVPYWFDRYNYSIYFSLIDAYQGAPIEGDWFTRTSADYNGYFLFTRAMALIPREYLPGVFFVLWGLGFPALGWVFIYLGRAISGEGGRGLAAGIIAFAAALLAFDPAHWSWIALGDHGIFFSFLNPQIPGQTFGMIGLLLLLRGRAAAAGLLLGFAIDAHLNTGQIFFALFAAAAAARGRAGMKEGALALGIALAAGAPNLVPAVLDQVLARAERGAPEFSYILISGYLRHPHHLIPSAWPAISYVKFGALMALAAAGWFSKREKTDFDRAIGAALAMCLALCFAGWFFVEVVPLDFAAKSQLFRSTAIAQIFALPYAVQFLFVLAARGVRAIYSDGPIMLTVTPNTGRDRELLAVLLIACAGAAAAERRILPRGPLPVEAAAERLTKPGSVFLLPLRDGELREFPVMARRAVFVDWHRFPFQRRDYVEWHERICAVMGAEPQAKIEAMRALGRADARPASQSQSLERLKSIAAAERVTHAIRYARMPIRGLAPIWSDEKYLIYELPKE